MKGMKMKRELNEDEGDDIFDLMQADLDAATQEFEQMLGVDEHGD